jgi:hypothetical protein
LFASAIFRGRAAVSVLVDALADAQDVAVGVADVHLANVPRLVLGWAGDLQAVAEAGLVDLIDVVDPDL